MTKLLTILAKIMSVVFYPLFLPTYGMILYCVAYSIQVAPLALVWAIVAILGTFLLTCVLPITAIWILMRKGSVSDLQIENATERTMPYIYSLMGFAFWTYLCAGILHAPLFLSMIAGGATLTMGMILIINKKWKISAHLTGMGGFLGGVLSYYLSIGSIPSTGFLCVLLGISLLLMYARLWLNAHSSGQVVAGWLMGIICTFVPNVILYYVR